MVPLNGTMEPCTARSWHYGASVRFAVMSGLRKSCRDVARDARRDDGMVPMGVFLEAGYGELSQTLSLLWSGVFCQLGPGTVCTGTTQSSADLEPVE